MPQRVFVDADVLASRTAYEWLARLRDELDGAFQLHSTAGAVDDAVHAWVARDPVARQTASRRRLQLLSTSLDEVFGTADERPRRAAVTAAASTHAHVLVSSSIDQPSDADLLPFEICTPDQFLCLIDDAATSQVRDLTRRLRERERLAGGVAPLEQALVSAGCPAFAERVAAHLPARAGRGDP